MWTRLGALLIALCSCLPAAGAGNPSAVTGGIPASSTLTGTGTISSVSSSSQTAPAYGDPYYRTIAVAAMNDILAHFWVGDLTTGHILNTWGGYGGPSIPDPRGALWERAMLVFAMKNLYDVTADPVLAQRITRDWQYIKSVYTAAELVAVGSGHQIYGCDDAGWDTMFYLAAYDITHDPYALDRAKVLATNAFNQWYDDQVGGGMWYNDNRQWKSLYQAGNAISSLRIYQLTGDREFLRQAMLSYVWMEKFLLRPDGLYWCDRGLSGPNGGDRPNDIREAGSVTFLGGNMAMAVLHARLYRMTGQDIYRARAVRTANGILGRLVNRSSKVLIDDRDAWVNATFACQWVKEVLTLPGIDLQQVQIICNTANSIYTLARTPDGYYSGCWSGTADGTGCAWYNVGSKADQIMTSANSVNMIVAAASVVQTGK
jgi:hypothetical protein